MYMYLDDWYMINSYYIGRVFLVSIKYEVKYLGRCCIKFNLYLDLLFLVVDKSI